MIIAIAVDENNGLDSVVSSRFGRAAGFLVCNTDDNSCEYLENVQNLNAASGAGIQAASNVADAGAEAAVTGHCGPKAFRVLSAAGISVYLKAGCKVSEALEAIKSEQLQPTASADVEGHWS